MARVTFQIPDDLYDSYATRAKDRHRHVDHLLSDELKAIFPLDLTKDRTLVIDPANRQRIESLLNDGHLQSASDLVDKLERLLAIGVGGFNFEFTPSQRHELKELAARNGFTPEDLARATVKSMEELFFSRAYDEASKHSEEQRVATMEAPAADIAHAGDLVPVEPKPAPPIPTNAQGTASAPSAHPRKSPRAFERIREAIRGKKV